MTGLALADLRAAKDDIVRGHISGVADTQTVDLDAIEAASHAAVTTAGTAANNPIVATGQALSFNISGLTSAP